MTLQLGREVGSQEPPEAGGEVAGEFSSGRPSAVSRAICERSGCWLTSGQGSIHICIKVGEVLPVP